MSFSRFHCLSASRRLLCLILAAAFLLLAGCKTEIYQGLSENQANTMLSVLLRHGISAEKIAAKNDFSIAVEEKQIVQALEILKENSLPREDFQSLGQVFSAQGMISSTTEEQARLAYALSQELSDTFSRIDGVLTARVHVVLGQTDLGTGNVTPPSAAVFLRHTPESQATRLIPYIRELAANAVPGLMQDRVSVMLVPVRETVSVPMPAESGAAGTDNSRLYLLAGLAGLLALACIGLAAAAVIYVRNRRNKAQ
ncbi:type III secretion system inner membrane ring lipoprotein SctJ [uncultured Mailhella sp.]|uniref:type III secretion system inner membrane ring lipoprotein SctJ n=1 Tax=uncultured Mailhella sp. TaxID=1981031 RepID=UPI002600BE06|nr:type III secretion inner membrane ring lipoprotein SctJ [uncultured Mailhella sp.]